MQYLPKNYRSIPLKQGKNSDKLRNVVLPLSNKCFQQEKRELRCKSIDN